MIATGARYRFGLDWLVAPLLDRGIARWPGLRRGFAAPGFRNWFIHRRAATGDALRRLARPGQKVQVIGDALRAGKSKEAIASAFAAALLGEGGER